MADVGQDNPDLSLLPDVVWVRVLSYLSLSDRYHLSITCRALRDIFNHPSLWKTADITFVNCSYTSAADIYYEIVKRFGNFFQDLTLRVSGHMYKLPDKWVEVLMELGHRCRLETLRLEVGIVMNEEHSNSQSVTHPHIFALLSLVRNAFRLKHFILKSWPMYSSLMEVEDMNIFKVLMHNTRIKNLETLSLFWVKETEWVTRNALVPATDEMLEMVKHFRCLTRLALRSYMLTPDILHALSEKNRSKLEHLQILVVFSQHQRNLQIPEISSQTWCTLIASSPRLEVECSILSRVSHMDLAALFKPEVPLTSIIFFKFSRLDSPLLQSTTDKYWSSLQRFVCYHDSKDVDDELVAMVTKCSRLTHFICHSHMLHTTVKLIAEMRRDKWIKFEVCEKHILTQDPRGEDSTTVIGRREDPLVNEWYLVDFERFFESDYERQKKLYQLCDDVSNCLGYRWHPV